MFKKTLVLIFIFAISFTTIHAQISGKTYYVDANNKGGAGCNDAWSGTITQPLCTINKAQSLVSSGSTVYVRGGIYHQKVAITTGNGHTGAPVVYKPYPNESVVIDGTGVAIIGNETLVSLYGVNDINFIGFEIANSPGRGLSVSDSNYVLIQGNKIHDIWNRAIGANGTNIIIDRNEVYNVALSNTNAAFGTGGWPGAVSTWLKPDGSASQNINITNNLDYNSWGEGISAIALDGGIFSGNRIKDTFSVLLYVDNSRNIVADGNYLTATNSVYFRSSVPASGIMISSESCCKPSPNFTSQNITLSNNLIVNTGHGIRYWQGDYNNPYSNMSIFYNTIKDTKDVAIDFDSIVTSGNKLQNNIIYGNAIMPDASAWTFSNNNWPSGKPVFDTSSTSFSADPLFVSPILNGPADGYKLQPGSSSIGKGKSVSVIKDYFSATRNTSPTIGFYEYNQSQKPGDINKDGSVNILDIGIIIDNYGMSNPTNLNADLNNDGSIDIVDIGITIDNYGT